MIREITKNKTNITVKLSKHDLLGNFYRIGYEEWSEKEMTIRKEKKREEKAR